MSDSGGLGSIKSSVGLGSGIPIQELVEDTVGKTFAQKRKKINETEVEIQSKTRILGKLKSKLSDLQEISKEMALSKTLLSKASTVVNNPALPNQATSYLGVSVGNSAQNSTYQVAITSLATTDKYVVNPPLASPPGTPSFTTSSQVVGNGTLHITLKHGQSGATTYSYMIDTENNDNTVAGICNIINQQSNNTGIFASLINSANGVTMSISSNSSGLPSTLNITASNDGGTLAPLCTANMTHAIVAQNAVFSIDGTQVTSESNHAVNVIEGVTFELLQATGGLANTVHIKTDSSQTAAKIKKFVEKYNDVIELIDSVTQRKDDKNKAISSKEIPKEFEYDYEDVIKDDVSNNNDKETKKKRDDRINQKTGNGIFIGDVTLLSLRTALAQAVSTQVNQVQYCAMSQIGIISDRKSSKLELKEDKLKDALNSNVNSVVNLFTFQASSAASGSDGVGRVFNNMLENYVKPRGIVLNATINLAQRLEKTCVARLEVEKAASRMQYDLTMRYSKLDQILAKQKNNESTLMQSLAGLQNNN